MTTDPILFYLAAVLVIASLIDIRSFRIPNWLTYSTLAVGISYFTIVRGYEGLLFSLAGAAAGFALLILPYIIGGAGAGDVKLMGVVGSFLGAQGVVMVFLISCILAGIYALILISSKGTLIDTLKRYGKILKGFIITQQFIYIPPSFKEKQVKICYGLIVALATGSYLVFGARII